MYYFSSFACTISIYVHTYGISIDVLALARIYIYVVCLFVCYICIQLRLVVHNGSYINDVRYGFMKLLQQFKNKK